MDDPGFYLVHRSADAGPALKLTRWCSRPSLVLPQPVIKYAAIRRFGSTVLVNERGDVVVFQRYAPTLEEGQSIGEAYEAGTNFQVNYQAALKTVASVTGRALSDFDDTFLAEFRDGDSEIFWNRTHLPLKIGEAAAWQILAEALFIFSLRTKTERLLHEIVTDMPARPALRPLLRHAGDLLQLEEPEQYLVGEREIALMSSLYSKWQLSRDMKKLQERISQLTSAYSVLFNQQQATRAVSLSQVAAAIGVLALLSVSSQIADIIKLDDRTAIDTFLILIAILIVGYTLVQGWLLPVFSLISRYVYQFVLRQIVRRNLDKR